MGHVPAFTNQYKILWGFQLGRVGPISISHVGFGQMWVGADINLVP